MSDDRRPSPLIPPGICRIEVLPDHEETAEKSSDRLCLRVLYHDQDPLDLRIEKGVAESLFEQFKRIFIS